MCVGAETNPIHSIVDEDKEGFVPCVILNDAVLKSFAPSGKLSYGINVYNLRRRNSEVKEKFVVEEEPKTIQYDDDDDIVEIDLTGSEITSKKGENVSKNDETIPNAHLTAAHKLLDTKMKEEVIDIKSESDNSPLKDGPMVIKKENKPYENKHNQEILIKKEIIEITKDIKTESDIRPVKEEATMREEGIRQTETIGKIQETKKAKTDAKNVKSDVSVGTLIVKGSSIVVDSSKATHHNHIKERKKTPKKIVKAIPAPKILPKKSLELSNVEKENGISKKNVL